MRRRPYGPEGWLIEDIDDPAGWAAGLRAAAPDGLVEVVPAESSVLVVCERRVHERLGPLIDGVVGASPMSDGEPVVDIDVVYDGEDLDAVAARVGLSTREVIDRHSAGSYEVAFCGFSPGFAYLTGLDPTLHLPRRDSPRRAVPAGSVAIAAGYSCVYPSASPGGWHLLGTTRTTVWDLDRRPPAVLRPGLVVRFRDVGR